MWTETDIEPIAHHAVGPDEVEEVIASGRIRRRRRNDRHQR